MQLIPDTGYNVCCECNAPRVPLVQLNVDGWYTTEICEQCIAKALALFKPAQGD